MLTFIFQSAPYNVLKYTVIGNNPAPLYFSVAETTGEVTLRSALYSDQSQSQYIVSIVINFFLGTLFLFHAVIVKDVQLIWT